MLWNSSYVQNETGYLRLMGFICGRGGGFKRCVGLEKKCSVDL